jgi:hypothetical protein
MPLYVWWFAAGLLPNLTSYVLGHTRVRALDPA